MNIINAGNPSANNMIIRQVMQKKPTFFDERNTNLSIPIATKAKGIRLGVIVQK